MREGERTKQKPINSHGIIKELRAFPIESKKYFSSKGEPTMTKREMFVALTSLVALSNLTDEDKAMLTEGLNHEIALLDKKASTPRKPTSTQVENETFKAELLSFLVSADAAKTIKDIQSECATFAELSNQRMSHLLSALIAENKVSKSYVKKTPYYSAI